MLAARVLADAIVVLHLAYVAFVVLGMAAIVVGLWRGWGWVRDVRFRVAHLAAIGVVVVETALGVPCPLTTWENRLRTLAGQRNDSGDFVSDLVHRLIFFDAPKWAFTLAYVLFGAAVLATFVLGPPRRRDRGDARPLAPRGPFA